jgi:ABC-type sugar transport system ATPase subunit
MNFIPGEVQGSVFRFTENAHANGSEKRGARSENQETDRSSLLAPRSFPLSGELHVGDGIPPGPATLGVRPEDLLAHTNGSPLATVTLDVVEHMGHETIAHFVLGGADHVARLPATARVQPGDRLPLSIRPGAFHLFSAADGRRLN